MSEMIERVAKAIYEADDVWSAAFPWPTMGSDEQSADNYRRIARAAITAMADPTPKMMEAGWMAQYVSIGATDTEARKMVNEKILLDREKEFLRAGWSAAITAALQD
jgi:hypothetical protein